jgi:hypothetical protein
MPFYIITADLKQLAWYKSEHKPKFDIVPPTKQHIDLLQASGEELALIRKHFDNIPLSLATTCTWRGDMAQFIYDNL